jgi:allantoate deiminase
MTAAEVVAFCRTLAACSEQPGAITRTFLSPPMREVHALLTRMMEASGMTVHVDAVGNLRGVYPADRAESPRFIIGSHLDTVRDAGAFDGVLGVILGIALVQRLAARRLPFEIEVIGFSEEEGVRFGIPFIGSRALAGTLAAAVLKQHRDRNGCSIRDAILAYGLDPGALRDALMEHRTAGYLEFHIEQGPVLDAMQLPIGVVSAIVGQSRFLISFVGQANHAGTTPIGSRRDALAGAAEWIARVESEMTAVPGLVATVGRVDVFPGAANVIPGECLASLDVRHAVDAVRHDSAKRLEDAAREIGIRRGLVVDVDPQLDQAAVRLDAPLRERLERAVARCGYPVHVMTSGAGHDAMVLAPHLPTAMLFVRTPGGISHHPDESVQEEDVEAAIRVGTAFLDDLARAAP